MCLTWNKEKRIHPQKCKRFIDAGSGWNNFVLGLDQTFHTWYKIYYSDIFIMIYSVCSLDDEL